MATVKFDEGTKFETSLNLEDGEGVIYARPLKCGMYRFIPGGCLFLGKRSKTWQINLVITDKRLVTIPVPPNKKNFPVESYYFKDLSGAQMIKAMSKDIEAAWAYLRLDMKQGVNVPFDATGQINIRVQMTAKNLLIGLKASVADAQANGPQYNGFAEYAASGRTDSSRAHAEATGASHYTEYSPNYAKMQQAAQAKVAGMDFSKMGHNQIRDIIVDLVNQYIEIANA